MSAIDQSNLKRLHELLADGYMTRNKDNVWFVTNRGLKVLMACADRPARKPPRIIPIKIEKDR